MDNKYNAFFELEQGILTVLETYSNVHRGSGHNSMVTTELYEQAREIVLDYIGLDKSRYILIFCTPARAAGFMAQLKPGKYQALSSQETGLSLGITALAIRKSAVPKQFKHQTGGGAARLIAPGWVIWAKGPDRFEAGTPAIVNIIAFARALQIMKKYGKDAFRQVTPEKISVEEILYHDELEEYSGQVLLEKLRQTFIGKDIQVPTAEGTRRFVNLDNGASTPTFRPVWSSVCQTWKQPPQLHHEIIREVKKVCAESLGAPAEKYDVLFTSNTTEAINLVAESLVMKPEDGNETVVLNTFLEHSSNELPWRRFPQIAQLRLAVDDEGFMDLKEMESLLRDYNEQGKFGKKRIRLVAVSGASNVLGVFNDLEEISRIVHRFGAQLLVDGAQLIAHRKFSMEDSGIDYLAFSAHKAYAPFGTGALITGKGLLNFGGSELELIHRSGEENAGGIAALGKALILLQRIGLDVIREEEQALTARALRNLAKIPGIQVFGIKDPDSTAFSRKGGVIIFSLKGTLPNVLARKLAEQGGIGVRYGCHCSHLMIKRLLRVPPWAENVQGIMLTVLPKMRLPGLTRVSLGIENTNEDIDHLIRILGQIAARHTRGREKSSPKRLIEEYVNARAKEVYPGV